MREFLDLYARDGKLVIADMPGPDRAEAREILGRIGDLDTRRSEERQKMLLDIARAEDAIREILDRGQPRHRGGRILLDPKTGEPLRNRNVDRSARAELRKLQRLRSQLTGLPPEGQDS